MTDIMKGAISNAWGLIVGWIMPSGLSLLIFDVLVLPSLGSSLARARDLTEAYLGGPGLTLLVVSVALGWLLAAIQTPLYAVLEGYLLWPKKWHDTRVAHHKRRRQQLDKRAHAPGDPRDRAQVLQRFFMYPDDEDQVQPTRLGNAIRSFEYYGHNRYQLDSQRLWYQLRTCVPKPLAKDAEDARVHVDFFVCLAYTLGAVSAAAVLALLFNASQWLQLTLTAAGCGIGAALCYQGAVIATDAWGRAVRAMVDLGRVPLAVAYGLMLPERLEDEREMWQVVGWVVGFPYPKNQAQSIDRFRLRTAPPLQPNDRSSYMAELPGGVAAPSVRRVGNEPLPPIVGGEQVRGDAPAVR